VLAIAQAGSVTGEQSEGRDLLDGDYCIVYTMKSVPVSVVNSLTAMRGGRPLNMVDPGQSFNATDVGTPGRRLIFAGVSKEKCFLYYEEGGMAHMYHLAVFRITGKNAIYLGGRSGIKVRTFSELRRAIHGK
jgi:hypothetical protein